MKVGYILKKFPRLSETFILNEIHALERQGHDVHVFSLQASEATPDHPLLRELSAPVTVIDSRVQPGDALLIEKYWKQGLLDANHPVARLLSNLDLQDPWQVRAFGYALVLAPIAEELGIEHFHAHFGTIATSTAATVARTLGRPFSFTLHAKDIYRETVNFGLLTRWLQQSAFAVTVCDYNARWMAGKCGEAAVAGLHTIYNGLDLERWRPAETLPDPATFCAVGRFVEKKGFDVYLRACDALRRRGRNFNAFLVGEGDLESRLKSLASDLGLEDVVTFTGPLGQDEVGRLIVRSAALVAPCVRGEDGNQDALPTVILEAMALGKPVISTRIGGVPEMVADPQSGWLVPSGDPEALATAMEEVLDDAGEARARGREGRRRAEGMFDLDRNIRSLAALMEEAVIRNPAAAPADSLSIGASA